MAKEIGKGKVALIGILFMKIMEIRRKGRWKVTGCMWGGKWRKIMENEENRGLIDKKASEDQLAIFFSWLVGVTFFQFSFGALSLFCLSLSWTLRVFLEHFGIGSIKAKKARGRKDQEGKAGSSTYNKLHCRYRLACVFSLLYLTCMVLHVVILLLWHGFC